MPSTCSECGATKYTEVEKLETTIRNERLIISNGKSIMVISPIAIILSLVLALAGAWGFVVLVPILILLMRVIYRDMKNARARLAELQGATPQR